MGMECAIDTDIATTHRVCGDFERCEKRDKEVDDLHSIKC